MPNSAEKAWKSNACKCRYLYIIEYILSNCCSIVVYTILISVEISYYKFNLLIWLHASFSELNNIAYYTISLTKTTLSYKSVIITSCSLCVFRTMESSPGKLEFVWLTCQNHRTESINFLHKPLTGTYEKVDLCYIITHATNMSSGHWSVIWLDRKL